MAYAGKQLFKVHDDLLRLTWYLETEGLDTYMNAISQIGIRTNHGYQRIITIDGKNENEKIVNEIKAIDEFFKIIHDINPDIVTDHNTETSIGTSFQYVWNLPEVH